MATRLIALMLDLDRPGKPERDLLAGVKRYAAEHPDWQVVVDPFACRHPGAGYAGIIARAHIKHAIEWADSRVPIIGVTRVSWHRGTVPRVLPNASLAGRLAAEHLLARGFLRFGFVGFRANLEHFFLHDAFAKRIRRSGFSRATWLVHRKHLRRALDAGPFERDFARWLDQVEKPAGLLVADDALARYVATRCTHLGLRIPEDLGLVSVGNDPDLCQFPPPALTAVDLGYDRVGYHAAWTLDRLIAGDNAPTWKKGLPPTGIVARRSTDVDLFANPFAQQVARWLADHCHEPLRMRDVAAAFATSERSLQRRCRHHLDGGVAGELLRARLLKAQRLLAGTDLSVDDVAAACGLRSRTRLARAFAAHLGTSPAAWRTAARKPQ